jgi:DNA repair photolyase
LLDLLQVTMLTVKTICAKRVLNKSKIFDYCVNPYTGCQINCRYCYARLFMKRYSGHKEPWGEFVDVKINAAEVLEKQISRRRSGPRADRSDELCEHH